MSTEMIRLNITLPRDLVVAMNSLTGRKERSRFIREAVLERIEKQRKREMEQLLAEGYRERVKDNLALTEEFNHADLERWDDY